MMYSNVIVGVTVSRGSFVFSQSRVKVSASLTNVGSLAVGAFNLLCYSVSLKHDILRKIQFFSKMPPASDPSNVNFQINYFIQPLSVLSFAFQGKHHRKYTSLLAEQILVVYSDQIIY